MLSRYPQFAELRVQAIRDMPRRPVLDDPAKVADLWWSTVVTRDWFDPDNEQLVVFGLNARNRCEFITRGSSGTGASCDATATLIFRPAVAANVAAIVLAHNHPSGDPMPSEPDIVLTRKLRSAGQILGVELHDHLIFSSHPMDAERRRVSLRELGYF